MWWYPERLRDVLSFFVAFLILAPANLHHTKLLPYVFCEQSTYLSGYIVPAVSEVRWQSGLEIIPPLANVLPVKILTRPNRSKVTTLYVDTDSLLNGTRWRNDTMIL